jgi:predicted peptidase
MIVGSLCSFVTAVSGEPEAREWMAGDGTRVHYQWHAPVEIEDGRKYPLVLFLHGSGERGTDNRSQLKHGVGSIIEQAGKLGEPCFLIAPQCPPDSWWTDGGWAGNDGTKGLTGVLLELVAESMATHPVDPKRFYVTGLSMGGFGTWKLLALAPDKIAAAVPICGGGDPKSAVSFKDVPVWAFHGEADEVVPVRVTREMIAAMEKAGGKPKATYYPEVRHDSWTITYRNPEVIRWLFDQKK